MPRLLAALPAAAVVISGLPLDGLAPDLRARIIAKALEVSAGGPFVQFSYVPHFPVHGPWCVYRIAIVWRNLPPAAVFVARV